MHKISFTLNSRISDVMAINVLMSATVVIEIILPVGKLTICSEQAVSCQVCFNLSSQLQVTGAALWQ